MMHPLGSVVDVPANFWRVLSFLTPLGAVFSLRTKNSLLVTNGYWTSFPDHSLIICFPCHPNGRSIVSWEKQRFCVTVPIKNSKGLLTGILFGCSTGNGNNNPSISLMTLSKGLISLNQYHLRSTDHNHSSRSMSAAALHAMLSVLTKQPDGNLESTFRIAPEDQ